MRGFPISVRFFGALAAISLLGVMLSGCMIIPRARTLPPTVRSVYLPMLSNETSEPGLEEKATRFIQREFLADGRLRLETRERADAWIECAIKKYELRPASFESDDFPSFSQMTIRAELVIRENIPTFPTLGGKRKVEASYSYPSDLRRSLSYLDTEATDRLMEDLARQVVRETLTGEYGEESLDTSRTTSPPPRVEDDFPATR